jgi:hypothetical protein
MDRTGAGVSTRVRELATKLGVAKAVASWRAPQFDNRTTGFLGARDGGPHVVLQWVVVSAVSVEKGQGEIDGYKKTLRFLSSSTLASSTIVRLATFQPPSVFRNKSSRHPDNN